jgi:hypothetical protein
MFTLSYFLWGMMSPSLVVLCVSVKGLLFSPLQSSNHQSSARKGWEKFLARNESERGSGKDLGGVPLKGIVRTGGVAQVVASTGPEFKPQYHEKKKKERKKE